MQSGAISLMHYNVPPTICSLVGEEKLVETLIWHERAGRKKSGKEGIVGKEGRKGRGGFSRILHYAVTALKIKALSLLGAMSLLTHSGSTFLLFHQIIEGTTK